MWPCLNNNNSHTFLQRLCGITYRTSGTQKPVYVPSQLFLSSTFIKYKTLPWTDLRILLLKYRFLKCHEECPISLSDTLCLSVAHHGLVWAKSAVNRRCPPPRCFLFVYLIFEPKTWVLLNLSEETSPRKGALVFTLLRWDVSPKNILQQRFTFYFIFLVLDKCSSPELILPCNPLVK